MKVLYRIILVIIAAGLLGFGVYKIRMYFCVERNKPSMNESGLSEAQLQYYSNLIPQALLTVDQLAEQVRPSRVLMVGEPHLQIEVMEYFCELMDALDDDQIVLNLELPPSMQTNIDSWMLSGDLKFLDSLAACKTCLPLEPIFQWCYTNQDRIVKIQTIDEEIDKILWKRRCLCADTRNRTMARQLVKSYKQFPDARIIFYGGQLHAMKDGRYKYDVRNRIPAGYRIKTTGIPKAEIKVIMISGQDEFSLAPAWQDQVGALDVRTQYSTLPLTYFYTYPLFRMVTASEMFDFYVNVGEVTMVEM